MDDVYLVLIRFLLFIQIFRMTVEVTLRTHDGQAYRLSSRFVRDKHGRSRVRLIHVYSNGGQVVTQRFVTYLPGHPLSGLPLIIS
jgi:hypothetical protein